MGITGNITIPAEADVRLNTTFGANNSLTGEMSAGTPALEWSATVGPMNWADGVAYCSGLGGGYRLPYLEELIQESPMGKPGFIKVGGFSPDIYWSGSTKLDYDTYAYMFNMDPDHPIVEPYDKAVFQLLIRCTH